MRHLMMLVSRICIRFKKIRISKYFSSIEHIFFFLPNIRRNRNEDEARRTLVLPDTVYKDASEKKLVKGKSGIHWAPAPSSPSEIPGARLARSSL